MKLRTGLLPDNRGSDLGELREAALDFGQERDECQTRVDQIIDQQETRTLQGRGRGNLLADPKGTLLGPALLTIRTGEQDAEWLSKDSREHIPDAHPAAR